MKRENTRTKDDYGIFRNYFVKKQKKRKRGEGK